MTSLGLGTIKEGPRDPCKGMRELAELGEVSSTCLHWLLEIVVSKPR